MKKLLIIALIINFGFTSCEDIYRPELDVMEDLLVVEARIVHGQSENTVKIYKTVNFNSPDIRYPVVDDAEVKLVDETGSTISLNPAGQGTYQLAVLLTAGQRYKLVIEAEGDTYESAFQDVPKAAVIDSVYLAHTEKLVPVGTDASAHNLRRITGAQLFIDIADKGGATHYRFTSRKIGQYTYNIGFPEVPVYGWVSLYPGSLFNLAAPPEYSVSGSIKKHPLVFLENSYMVFIPDRQTTFRGWIYICHQYALNEQTYNYYIDMNRQLSAGGKLFDPVYTQARGNLSCITDPEKVILGNFEISTVSEHRFFVAPLSQNNYFIKRIPYFWNIPQKGESEELLPEWWETMSRRYPSGEPGENK
jgi:hypothetical protein